MLEKILMVDDESSVLAGYQRLFHNEFQIDTAAGGAAALSALEATGPYAVVVSDMRMPEMDGAQLLANQAARAGYGSHHADRQCRYPKRRERGQRRQHFSFSDQAVR
jgi:CheY-like chemotaxis protein